MLEDHNINEINNLPDTKNKLPDNKDRWLEVSNNIEKYNIQSVLYIFINDDRFNENYILNNMVHFEPYLKYIVKHKKQLSDEFFEKIFTKNNYYDFKCTRRLLEPYRDLKKFDDKFY